MTATAQENAIAVADAFLAQSEIPLYINGAWKPARDGKTFEVRRPSTGERLATISSAGAADVDEAVQAARSAFPAWSDLDTRDRAVLLHRLADAMERDQDVLASLESRNIGKSLPEALDFDILFAAQGYRYFADLATHTTLSRPLPLANMEASQVHRPRGVCGFVIPWNAPSILTVWGIAPALAAGNTVVLKPAELAPLSVIYLARLAEEVGFPSGVINVVTGLGSEAGDALANHPGLNYISFTGSPQTGKLVAEAAARNLVPSKMELGGKGAAVIFPDIDVKDTAEKLGMAIVRNAGQTCCTATRWFIHDDVYDDLVSASVDFLERIRLGPDTDHATQLGAVISEGQRSRIQSYLDQGLEQGATPLLEGGATQLPGLENGYYVSPVLMTGRPDNVCAREEIFGPVAYVMPFSDEADVIEQVNSSHYGLANSVWSEDLNRAYRVAERMVSGNSWINAHNVFAYGLPYGGVNLSGWGGGVNSQQTYLDYLRPMSVVRPLT
ncbi:aldehyde dehydrogenase family protein [Nocardioides humi]|uniref:Aldehyde dehydrogenase family protein n=1 Tax=Nocardioides humi TaxID=449461 RepID=A0ABN2BVW1_9ACTN|nr:aldehyde dehydrogenase family protein [Nocardioides humi]